LDLPPESGTPKNVGVPSNRQINTAAKKIPVSKDHSISALSNCEDKVACSLCQHLTSIKRDYLTRHFVLD